MDGKRVLNTWNPAEGRMGRKVLQIHLGTDMPVDSQDWEVYLIVCFFPDFSATKGTHL